MSETIICVDNSLAVKWATSANEQNWQEARHFLALWRQNGTKLIAPPVFDGELRKALHRKVEEKWITEEEYLEGLHLIRTLVEIQTHPDLEYVALAFERYLKAKDTYDTMYMALAALNRCELWTHDDKWVDRETQVRLSDIFSFIKVLQSQTIPQNLLVPTFDSKESTAMVVKQFKADILFTELLNPHHPQRVKNSLIIIPGISGDGSNGTPDYIDREHTTAYIDPINHTIG